MNEICTENPRRMIVTVIVLCVCVNYIIGCNAIYYILVATHMHNMHNTASSSVAGLLVLAMASAACRGFYTIVLH